MNGFERVGRNPIAWAVALIAIVILCASVFAVVPETKQALIVRLGKPNRIINPYKPNQEFGRTGAGLIAHWPFLEQIVWIDKRVLDFDMDRQSVLSTDQLRLEVDAFARYRIVNPLQMYISAGSERRVGEALRPILGSALRNELGKRPFAALLSPERGQLMDNIQAGLNRIAGQYGAEIVDVRIKRADLPDGTPLESAFERMRTAREQQALTIRAEGAKQAQIVRADADAGSRQGLCRQLRQGSRFLRFLPGDAVLPGDVRHRRHGSAGQRQRHPVARQRISAAVPGPEQVSRRGTIQFPFSALQPAFRPTRGRGRGK